jgi:ABC-type hemin transport system substrate-binding protein
LRVVSLVPSLTETVLELGLPPEQLVGRTAFCVSPEAVVSGIDVVGGTKTPSLKRVVARRPDLVLLDEHENRREDAEALAREEVELFVVRLEGPDDVPVILRRLADRLDLHDAGERAASRVEAELAKQRARAANADDAARAAILVWREPLIAVSPALYASEMLRALGRTVPSLSDGPYPVVDVATLADADLDELWLPDEPHPFTLEEGREIAEAVGRAARARPRPLLVDGQDLLWYGTRTADALARLGARLRDRAGEAST